MEKNQIESTISQHPRSIIGSLTNATIEDILFDSSCENWSKGSIEFTLSIERRNGLFFLIIVAEGNSFGYFFNERMKGTERNGKMSESFYISPLNGKVMKEMTKGKIELYGKKRDELVKLGNILLMKEEKKEYFGWNKKGEIDHCFTLKHLVVLQMN